MLDKLNELNEQFFVSFGAIDEVKNVLPQNQLEFMQEKLFEQYKIEYKKLVLQEQANIAIETYELEIQNAALIPKRGFFKNRSAKLIIKEMSEKIEEYFAKRVAQETQEQAEAEE